MTHLFPNLFVPGAAKCGTTTLHDLLNCHPDICMSVVKEPVYWNSEGIQNEKRANWYRKLFGNSEAKILGESTTSYMYFPEFISNVSKLFPSSPKFIFILRNPIDRCHSHYWWLKGRGQEKRTFSEAMQSDLNRSLERYGYLPNYYYHFGLYGKNIKRFMDAFGKDAIKIITLEELQNDRLKTLNSCFTYLGVSEMNSIPDIRSNETVKLKYPKLFHFINKTASGKYRYTKIAKYLISRERIDRIKRKLKKMRYFKGSEKLEYDDLSNEERKWIKSIYEEDVKLLKHISGLSYDQWTDFNS